jgi:hypothetical protein
MTVSVNQYDESYQAFGDMRSNQFFFVEYVAASDRIVQLCSAVNAVAIGVLQNQPNSGDVAVVRQVGVAKVLVNCVSISCAGYMVGTTALGGADAKLTAIAASGQYYLGVSREAAVTSGELCEVTLGGVPYPLN